MPPYEGGLNLSIYSVERWCLGINHSAKQKYDTYEADDQATDLSPR